MNQPRPAPPPLPLAYRAALAAALPVFHLLGRGITVSRLRRHLGPPGPGDASIERHDLGGVPAEVYPTASPPRGEALFFHGGAYIAGTPSGAREFFTGIAEGAGLRGWSLDYRLAPEHPFPAPVEDGLAAYRTLLDRGGDPGRVLVCGESAGGGAALGTVLAARDCGLPMPAGLLLFWPWTDLALTGDSLVRNRRRCALSRPLLDLGVRSYLAGADPRHPHASPLFADLSGLPPMCIHVGAHDLVVDDSTRLANAVRAIGGSVEVTVWPGMMHAFAMPGHRRPQSRPAYADAIRWATDAVPAPVAT